MPTKHKLLLEIKRNEALTADSHLLTLALDPAIARECRPGQFFNLLPLESTAPLLRRPISICDARPEEGELDFLIQTVGDGTRLLTRRRPGASINAMGPLGNPFDADPARPSLMIAGGVGVAPLYFLAKRLRLARKMKAGACGCASCGDASAPPPITFCYGARSEAGFVLLDEIQAVADRLVLATEDGSRGEKGYVTTLAEPLLDADTQIFVCGPSPMMNVVLKSLQEKGLRGQLSLENMMGCGVGACQGCVVPAKTGTVRVCCDGPVVSSDLLDFVLTD